MAAVIEAGHLPAPGVESRGKRGVAADVFTQAVHDEHAAARARSCSGQASPWRLRPSAVVKLDRVARDAAVGFIRAV